MNSQEHAETTDTPPPDEEADEMVADRYELATRIEVLEAENRQLRAEYSRARRVAYRRSAFVLTAIGFVALFGGVLFPADRAVFVVLGAIGLYGGVLIYYLAPDRVIPGPVAERVYASLAANLAAIARDLGLKSDAIYAPTGRELPRPARLFVPLFRNYELPSDDAGPLVLEGDERGLLLEPSGAVLFREFDRARTTSLAESPSSLATQLCDGLVEQLELATSATPDVDAADGRVTVAITDSTFGDVDRFDHPIPSFLAVGLAIGLKKPVKTDVSRGDDRAEWLVTCRYRSDQPEEK